MGKVGFSARVPLPAPWTPSLKPRRPPPSALGRDKRNHQSPLGRGDQPRPAPSLPHGRALWRCHSPHRSRPGLSNKPLTSSAPTAHPREGAVLSLRAGPRRWAGGDQPPARALPPHGRALWRCLAPHEPSPGFEINRSPPAQRPPTRGRAQAFRCAPVPAGGPGRPAPGPRPPSPMGGRFGDLIHRTSLVRGFQINRSPLAPRPPPRVRARSSRCAPGPAGGRGRPAPPPPWEGALAISFTAQASSGALT
jgi:hypothetical protein